MKYRYASDCHSHSSCSFDGEAEMSAMCSKALELGLYYYTVSDHCECNEYKYTGYHEIGYHGVVRKAWEQMNQCAEAFPQLRLLKGIELGQPLQNPPAAEDALSGRNYDLVIGSLHNIAGEKDFYHMGEDGLTPAEMQQKFEAYFQEILSMIQWGKFDTLAHLTYPLRYLAKPGTAPDFFGCEELLDEVLTQLIRNDKALEFNTSRLMRTDSPKLPDEKIFRRYRELGGKLITLGADAHRCETLAQGIDKGMDILKEVGFTEFTVFVQRKPVMLPLE